MIQINLKAEMFPQPWFSLHDHVNIVQKYDNVCCVVHELAFIIKQLEDKIFEIEKKQEPKIRKI